MLLESILFDVAIDGGFYLNGCFFPCPIRTVYLVGTLLI